MKHFIKVSQKLNKSQVFLWEPVKDKVLQMRRRSKVFQDQEIMRKLGIVHLLKRIPLIMGSELVQEITQMIDMLL